MKTVNKKVYKGNSKLLLLMLICKNMLRLQLVNYFTGILTYVNIFVDQKIRNLNKNKVFI